MAERIKVLMLCDHPLVPSGVGTQARYLIEGLLKTERYKFVVFGGAVKHPNYNIQMVEPDKFGHGNWIIHPVDGYGDRDKMRAILQQEKPDLIVLFTDPRFFVWVWEMEDEIRAVAPIVYWHVWDNDPTPRYNKVFYESTDFISALSLKTYGLLQDMEYPRCNYIPHAVSGDVFKPLPEDEIQKFKQETFGPHAARKFVAFWNNRNARRKMTGDVIATFAKFAEKVGKQNVALAMHTAVGDPEGQNIVEVAKCFDMEKNLIISQERVDSSVLNRFYNACDVTVNIANNEGFGLGTLESLMAGTPILVQMTGGLQYQIGDWYEGLKDFTNQDKLTEMSKKKYQRGDGKWFGIPVFPASRSCTGSQPIPYIYDDRVNHDDVVKGLTKLYEMGRTERRLLGKEGSQWARKTFDLNTMIDSWDRTLQEQLLKFKENGERNQLRVANL
jgi:glycosyltransferase involved in cell wall biosynthesis